MTTYRYECTIQRAADDPTPIVFEWARAGVVPVIEVAFDNVNFTALQGTITEITTGGLPRYRINYNSADRLTSAGLMTYRITEGSDVAYLELHITSPQNVPEPTDVASLATLIESIGPRRVKTKDMEIESHSLTELQRIQERNSSKPVGLGQMRGDVVSPKGEHWCYKQ